MFDMLFNFNTREYTAHNYTTYNYFFKVDNLARQVGHATEGLKLAPELKLLPDKLVTLSQVISIKH